MSRDADGGGMTCRQWDMSVVKWLGSKGVKERAKEQSVGDDRFVHRRDE